MKSHIQYPEYYKYTQNICQNIPITCLVKRGVIIGQQVKSFISIISYLVIYFSYHNFKFLNLFLSGFGVIKNMSQFLV